MSMEEKLYTVKYTPDTKSHLKPDQEQCKKCKSKICTVVCPANVYEWNGEQNIVKHENCLECGACRIACERNCIEWEYPAGNKGVMFKRG